MTRSMPSLKALTFCLWMKTADTGNEGTPLSYAVSGSDNELLLLDYRNFKPWVGTSHRYKHVKAWHFYLRLSFQYKYSSIQSGRYKISSLTRYVSAGKKKHVEEVSPLFFFLIILILRNRNGSVVRMLTSHKCSRVPYLGWVCYWSVFVLRQGFFVGVFWISSHHKKNLQKTAKANAMAIAPTKCWSSKFHIWSRFE